MSTESRQPHPGGRCPRCRRMNLEHARYCANCGLPLTATAAQQAGRIKHPQPMAAPDGFSPCRDAAQIYFAGESELGGKPLIGTEGMRIRLFNAGYGLMNAVFCVTGRHQDGRELFTLERAVAELPQGAERDLAVHSYEIGEPLESVDVALVQAEFAPPE